MAHIREPAGHLMSIHCRFYDLFRCELLTKHPEGEPSVVIQRTLSLFRSSLCLARGLGTSLEISSDAYCIRFRHHL